MSGRTRKNEPRVPPYGPDSVRVCSTWSGKHIYDKIVEIGDVQIIERQIFARPGGIRQRRPHRTQQHRRGRRRRRSRREKIIINDFKIKQNYNCVNILCALNIMWKFRLLYQLKIVDRVGIIITTIKTNT